MLLTLCSSLLLLITSGSHYVSCDQGSISEAAWIAGLRKFDHISHPLKQQFIDLIQGIASDPSITTKVSATCTKSLVDFASGLSQDDHKSMLMLDSFPKIRPGMITSQGYEYGSYQQCLSVGRYVYFGLVFPLPDEDQVLTTEKTSWQHEYAKGMNVRKMSPYTSAICVPDECTEVDLKAILSESEVMRESLHPLQVKIFTTESRSDRREPMSWVKIISLSLIATQILMCVIATAYNVIDPVHPVSKKMLAFDISKNARTLMQGMRDDSSSNHFSSLNIFRIGYILMAMIFHTIIGMSGVLTHVVEHVAARENSMIGAIFPLIPGSMPMNSVLSACLSILTWYPVMMQRNVSFMQFTIMRIFRTLPVLIGFILLTQTFPVLHFAGPAMKHVQENTANMCYKNGWAEVLFVSNFLPVNQMCNIVNWIVSLDMQLYVLSFVMIKLLISHERLAMILIAIQVVLGCIASGLYSWYHDVPAVHAFRLKHVHETYENYSIITHHTVHYISLYPLGTLFGYVMLKNGTTRRPIGYTGTFIVSAVSLFCLRFTATSYDQERRFRYPGWEFLFTSVCRFILSCCAVCVFYTLVNTTNSIINSIAQSRILTIISRLSFSILVTHVLMIHFVIASFESINTSPLIAGMMIATVTVFSIGTGIVMYLLVEAPYHNVLMNLTRGKRPLDHREVRQDNNHNVTKKE